MSYVRTAAVDNTIVGTHSNAVRGVNIENFIPPLQNGITTALGKWKGASRYCQICKLHGSVLIYQFRIPQRQSLYPVPSWSTRLAHLSLSCASLASFLLTDHSVLVNGSGG
jgi:hypothetical protein